MGVAVTKDGNTGALRAESKPSDTSNQSLDCALCTVDKCYDS